MDGQAGDDALIGDLGDDVLIGGAGNDVLDGGGNKDTMNGGAGNDSYVVDNLDDIVQEAANGGIDTVSTFIDFTLGANVENALILAGGHTVTGNDLNNVVTGSAGTDTVNGGKGADSLSGLGGNDILSGGDGNDAIAGGLGADTMNGGAGRDLFLYRLDNPADLATLGGDVITGFQIGQDQIDLTDLISDFNINSLDLVGQGFLKLEVVGGDTLLKFDSNGGGDSFVTLATLQGVTNASITDILAPHGSFGT